MKNLFKLFDQSIKGTIFMLFVFSFTGTISICAQEKQSISGKLIDGKNNQPVPFAIVALKDSSDSKIAGGAMSDDNGLFNISPVRSGSYSLHVSSIGFKPVIKSIEVINKGVTDAGIILLQDTAIILREMIIVGDRVKAKSESDRTVYNVTERIANVSNTGTDVLKLIPGIQVDLMQNISLEGSSDILIYVDAKERDKNFISQLNANQIDKIEIISVPPSNYDGNLTGAINIILKKDRDSGINGQILAEIPTSLSEVYIFPAYSLNYGFKKLNLYTSYNGELTYLDQREIISREVWNNSDTNRITTNQFVKQKNWSHRFHYGFDYFLSERDQFNFYAFYNPYSRELDGRTESQIAGTINNTWQAKKEDTDKNASSFYSLYYKHTFNKKGREITTDISSYSLKAENKTDIIQTGSVNDLFIQSNAVKPKQNIWSIKIDYSTPFLKKLNFSTGVKAKFQVSQDRLSDFKYRESIFALYGNIAYKREKYDLSAGLRAEKSVVNLEDTFTNSFPAILPYANIRYKITSRQNLQLAYNRSIRRPNLYQLNPYVSNTDPYSVSKGNPLLRPELLGGIFLEHSVQFNGNYFATRLFWNRATSVINSLTFINSSGSFETQVQNLGTLNQYGLQFSGSLKISILTFNPYVRIFRLPTSGNDLAKYYSIENKNRHVLQSGLSGIASFKHDLAFSLNVQYNTPNYDIQSKSFSDLSYFILLEKGFKQKFKVGIASALPFTRLFTYQGSEIYGTDFYSRYEGNVELSFFPLWFKLSYQFSSGRKRDKIERSTEEIENLPKKGF